MNDLLFVYIVIRLEIHSLVRHVQQALYLHQWQYSLDFELVTEQSLLREVFDFSQVEGDLPCVLCQHTLIIQCVCHVVEHLLDFDLVAEGSLGFECLDDLCQGLVKDFELVEKNEKFEFVLCLHYCVRLLSFLGCLDLVLFVRLRRRITKHL